MLKTLAASIFLGDLIATIIKSHSGLSNLFAIVFLLANIASSVAQGLHKWRRTPHLRWDFCINDFVEKGFEE